MIRAIRGQIEFSAVVLLGVASLLAPLARSAAGADVGLFDGLNADESDNSWEDDGAAIPAFQGGPIVADNTDDGSKLFTLRANALFLHRTSGSNVVLGQSSTGDSLLSTSQNNPGWAAGAEVDLIYQIVETTSIEAEFFSVQDWFNNNAVNFGATNVNQVAFPITAASSSTSSQLGNFELNLRQEFNDRLTLLAGFRYVSFNDSLGVHFGNKALGFSEDISTTVNNRLYGFQLGGQAVLWRRDSWELDGWLKAGIFGNSAIQGTDVATAGIAQQAATFSAVRSKSAFVGDLGVRGTKQLNKYFSAFAGYRLMFLDGVGLAGHQFPGAIGALNGGAPAISVGNSMLFQGLEVGLIFAY